MASFVTAAEMEKLWSPYGFQPRSPGSVVGASKLESELLIVDGFAVNRPKNVRRGRSR